MPTAFSLKSNDKLRQLQISEDTRVLAADSIGKCSAYSRRTLP